MSTQDFVVVAGDIVRVDNSSLSAQLLWLQGNQVSVSGSYLYNGMSFSTDCNCITMESCDFDPYYLPFLFDDTQASSNYSMEQVNHTYADWDFMGKDVASIVILANDSIDLSHSRTSVSLTAIYAPTVTLSDSLIDASGLGYASGTGYGCGYFDEGLNQLLGCTGTGGSHGGYGGNSAP